MGPGLMGAEAASPHLSRGGPGSVPPSWEPGRTAEPES